MSDRAPGASREASEIAAAFRGILDPLDRALGLVTSVGCGGLLLGLALWVLGGVSGSGGLGFLGFVVATGIGGMVAFRRGETAVATAVGRFHQRFPPGHRQREAACEMLLHLAYPNKAHQRLAKALGIQPPTPPALEDALAQQLQATGVTPPAPAPPEVPARPPAPPPPEAVRPLPPPGRRVIPIEPFAPADHGADGKPGKGR